MKNKLIKNFPDVFRDAINFVSSKLNVDDSIIEVKKKKRVKKICIHWAHVYVNNKKILTPVIRAMSVKEPNAKNGIYICKACNQRLNIDLTVENLNTLKAAKEIIEGSFIPLSVYGIKSKDATMMLDTKKAINNFIKLYEVIQNENDKNNLPNIDKNPMGIFN